MIPLIGIAIAVVLVILFISFFSLLKVAAAADNFIEKELKKRNKSLQ